MKRNIFYLAVVVSLVVLAFGSPSATFAQENEPKLAVVPSHVMKEVVGRILRHYFKPRAKEKIIYLSTQNIEPSWLPVIRNVRFQLLTQEEIKQRNAPVYFFHPAVVFEKGSEVGFNYGDPTCEYYGDSWYFRVRQTRIELRDHGSRGGGCSSSKWPSLPH